MKPLLLSSFVLVSALAVLPPATAAESTLSLNVRSGPGTSYRVVDTLFRGENVNVQRCQSNGWCYITHPGPDGWVSARYLVSNDFDDDYLEGRRMSPDVSFSIIIGGGRFPGFPSRPGGGGSGEDLVCLVTFFDRDDVAAGRDADVQRARVMPRSEAERRDGPNDRQAIFDYGTNRQTRETCDYLDRLN